MFVYGSATLLVIFIALVGLFLNGHDHGEFLSIVLAIVFYSIFVGFLRSLDRRGKYAAANLLAVSPVLLIALGILVAWGLAGFPKM